MDILSHKSIYTTNYYDRLEIKKLPYQRQYTNNLLRKYSIHNKEINIIKDLDPFTNIHATLHWYIDIPSQYFTEAKKKFMKKSKAFIDKDESSNLVVYDTNYKRDLYYMHLSSKK